MSDSNLKSKFTKHHCSLPFKGRLDPFRNVKVNFVKKWYLKAIIVSERHPLQHYYLQSSGAVAFEKRRHILSRFCTGQLVSQALESVYNPEYPSNTAVAEVNLNFTGSSIYSLTGSSMDYFEDSTSQPQQHSFDSSYTNGSSSAFIESGQVPSQQQTTGSTHSEKHQSKVRLFYEYRFDKRYFEERAVLANLSQNLRAEIRNHECRRLVNESVLFRNAPSHVVERILARLKHDVYLPNDVVVRAGQAGDCMFFLVSGTVAVVSRAGDEMLHLRDGAFFGELALLSVDERRMATVVAIEVCEVYRLDKEDFQQVVRPLRDMYDHIQEVAQKRLGELLAVEAMYKRLQSATA